MAKRFVSIWFRFLPTDWLQLQQLELVSAAFVLKTSSHGRMMISAVNQVAESQGIHAGMVLADARAIYPGLLDFDDIPGLVEKLLKKIAIWCIRFTPFVSVDLPDGLILDVSGCTHLWGGDDSYTADIEKRLGIRGYHIRVAMADTAAAARAVARFGRSSLIIEKEKTREALQHLPVAALQPDPVTLDLLCRLGLVKIDDLLRMPSSALQRRFGKDLILKINQALGREEEILEPVIPLVPYQERLVCMEPIVTAGGIEIAIKNLLESVCWRLQKEGKGLRIATLRCYRVDGKIVDVEIGTNRPSNSTLHLFRLFEDRLSGIEPAEGIELFTLDAGRVEDHPFVQRRLWETDGGLNDLRLSELIDRLTGKIGQDSVHRFLPAEHYWPERAYTSSGSLDEKLSTEWKKDKPRPVRLLTIPERIEVSAPIPDYPPMLFRHKGKLHTITKADGPERIEQEWWLQQGEHRDYYYVEDEEGHRYWVYRSGHYEPQFSNQWFLHGYFA